MSKRIRQYIGIFAAVAVYYVVHEGAHLLAALHYGVFKKVNVMGLGVQIDVYAERMTEVHLGLFCLAGPAAALLLGWLLILLAKAICRAKSKVFKAVMWYTTLTVLMLDPLYLCALCDLFGGGDMNGIALILPEIPVRIGFALIGIAHALVIWKYLLPVYTDGFREAQ